MQWQLTETNEIKILWKKYIVCHNCSFRKIRLVSSEFHNLPSVKIVDLFDDMCYACHKIYVEEKIAELKHQPHKVTQSCFEDQFQGYFLNSSSKKGKKSLEDRWNLSRNKILDISLLSDKNRNYVHLISSVIFSWVSGDNIRNFQNLHVPSSLELEAKCLL